MAFGYAYPAYECFKTVEKNKSENEQLLFWCQYWILVATLTVCERVGDAFISWLPMYSEAKLAFFIYLWYSKTNGTAYVYNSFFRPILVKHETEIDHTLLELRVRAGQIAVLYWHKVASYGQTRFLEILQYVSSQPTSQPNPNQVFATTQVQPKQPLPDTSIISLSQQQHQPAKEVDHPPTPPRSHPAATQGRITIVSGQDAVEATIQQSTLSSEMEAREVGPVTSLENGNKKTPQRETFIQEAIRLTRRKLRKTRPAASH
ncbi:hypothetical protein L1049_015407 [Liquidambar formosana]|uniref:HVA22-like protein n=1 Tax=Liquidambar formosana TaxID=63359 RepID=A0AAP0S463_LIQFO